MFKTFKFPIAHLYQNLLGLTILVIIGLICWPLAPKPNSTPAGILLPSGPLKSAISSDQVQVLSVMPPNAKILGVIHTKLYYPELNLPQEKKDMGTSLNYTKVLAAQAGANGVVPTLMGTTGIANPLDGFVVQANAISY